MEYLEELIYKVDHSEEGITELSKTVMAQVLSNPMVEDINLNSSSLCVYLKPITLTCATNDAMTINLGRMFIEIYSSGMYEVHAVYDDPDRHERVQELIEEHDRGCHPHVTSDGDLCLGNVVDIPDAASDKDIPMLVACLIEFLQTYNRHDTYWEPFVFKPCTQCEHDENSIDCMFCKCRQCGHKNDRGECRMCEQLGVAYADTGAYAVADLLHAKRARTDEDDFIEILKGIIPILKE